MCLSVFGKSQIPAIEPNRVDSFPPFYIEQLLRNNTQRMRPIKWHARKLQALVSPNLIESLEKIFCSNQVSL